MFFLVEFCLALAAIGIAFALPSLSHSWFEACEDWFTKIAKRRGLSVLLVGASALAIRAALLPVEPIPPPGVQDEFSQLLAADTFAHGRATNPPHPMWIHFETLSVIQQPTYQSKYPPAPPLLMALGQILGGHPFWGVWLSVGLMCGAICWMLQGWLSESWALLGGFLAVIRFGSFGYWADSYWGGTVAAFSGALIMGALPRIKKELRTGDAILMAIGLGILANTRPYEGLCFAIPVFLSLAWWFYHDEHFAWSGSAKHVLAPMLLVLLLIGATTCYYFWRVTGNPFRMPYQVYQKTYDPLPNFIWQSARALPPYRHKVMLAWELTRTQDWGGRTLPGVLRTCVQRAEELSFFYFGPLFGVVVFVTLAIAPRDLKWRQLSCDLRFLLIVLGVSIAAFMIEHSGIMHYLAQTTCIFVALVLLAMRYLQAWRFHGTQVGASLVRMVVTTCVVLFFVRAFAGPLHISTAFPISTWWTVAPQDSPNYDRARVASQFALLPGRHLAIVHYSANHLVSREWVYNAADIDGSKLIWAQDMGAHDNQELIDYYKDRRVWIVQPDFNPPCILPYESSAENSTIQTEKQMCRSRTEIGAQ